MVKNEETETSQTEQTTTVSEETTTTERTARRSFKSPEIVKDLDLLTGKATLKDFLTQKGVGDNDTKRCLAIAVWLKENRNITEITADHVYTCYRHMGWTTQNDVLGPIRRLKMDGAFSKGEARGTYAINHIGENRVMQMAPAKP